MTHDQKAIELLPCPFCGEMPRHAHPAKRIVCKCGGAGPWAVDSDDAVTVWNRRAIPIAPPAQGHETRAVELVACAMWRREAERAAPNVARGRTPEEFSNQSEDIRERWIGLASAAIDALALIQKRPTNDA